MKTPPSPHSPPRREGKLTDGSLTPGRECGETGASGLDMIGARHPSAERTGASVGGGRGAEAPRRQSRSTGEPPRRSPLPAIDPLSRLCKTEASDAARALPAVLVSARRGIRMPEGAGWSHCYWGKNTRANPSGLAAWGECAGPKRSAPTLPSADPPITSATRGRRGARIFVTVRKQALACGADRK